MPKFYDPESIILKTKQYEFRDGLRDIQLGVTLILIGIFWYWLMFEPNWVGFLFRLGDKYGSWATIIAFTLVLFIPIAISLGILPVIDYVRRRWIWQESGMIKSAKIVVPPSVTIISTIVFFGVLGLGFLLEKPLKFDELYIWSVLLIAIGWSFGYLLIGLGKFLKINRYIFIGIIGGVSSSGLILIQDSLSKPGILFFAGWGLLLLSSGLIVLRKEWPKVKEESNAG